MAAPVPGIFRGEFFFQVKPRLLLLLLLLELEPDDVDVARQRIHWVRTASKSQRSGCPRCERSRKSDWDQRKGGRGSCVGPATATKSSDAISRPSVALQSVAPCERWPSAANGYAPSAGFRSLRADSAFSAEYGGRHWSQRDSGSSRKSLRRITATSESTSTT